MRTPKSIYIKILVFCCIIGVSIAVLRPIQSVLINTVDKIRVDLLQNIENLTGLTVRYDSIRPSFFGSIEIRNLRFYKEGRAILTVSRIKVQFSLLRLIFGNKDAIHTINIEKPVLTMDIRRDMDIFSSFRKSEEKDRDIIKTIADFLPKNADFRILDYSLHFIHDKLSYIFTGKNFEIIGDKEDIFLDIFVNAEIRYTGFSSRTIVLTAGLDIKGITDIDLKTADANILFSSIICSEQKIYSDNTSIYSLFADSRKTNLENIFLINPFGINLSYKDMILNAEQMIKNENIFYRFMYNLLTEEMHAEITLNNAVPGRLVNFFGRYSAANQVINTPMCGNLFFLKDELNRINYGLNIDTINTFPYTAGNAVQNTYGILINIHGDNQKIIINDFLINASDNLQRAGLFRGLIRIAGSISFNPFLPDITVLFNQFSLTGTHSVNARFHAAGNKNDITVSGQNLIFGNVAIEDFHMSVYPVENDFGITASVFCPDNEVIFIDAIYSQNQNQLDTMASIDSFSLYNLFGILRPFVKFVSFPEFTANVFKNNKIDADIFFSTNFKNFIYNIPSIVLKNENITASASLSGSENNFILERGVIYLAETEVSFSTHAYFENLMDFNLYIYANYLDLSWNIDCQIIDGTTLIINDPNGLHAYGNVSNTGEFSGFIEGIDYPVAVNVYPVYLNFFMTLRFTGINFWALDVASLTVYEANSPEGENLFRIKGSMDQDGASFREIIYTDRIGTLFGNMDFSWDMKFSYLQFLINMTDGINHGENYTIEGILRDRHVSVDAVMQNMHINRYIRNRNTILASAHAKVTWDSINSFNADVNVSSFYAGLRNNSLEGSGGFKFTNDDLLIQDLKINYSKINANMPLLHFSRTEGFAKVQADINGSAMEKTVDIRGNINAGFNKMDSWFDITQGLKNFSGLLIVDNFHFGDVLEQNVEFAFLGNEEFVSVYGGIDNMLIFDMDTKGNFYMGLSSPSPIRGSFAGTLTKNFIMDAHCNYFFIDMNSLWTLVAPPNLKIGFENGFITGKINIKGPVWNPEFFGIAKGSSFIIQVPEFVGQDIRPVPFNIVAERYEMTFGPAVTLCGTGGGKASGWFEFENWVPRNIGIEIDIPRNTPIPYNLYIGGFSAVGDASGKMTILAQTQEKYFEILGDLFMNNSEIGMNMEHISLTSENDDENTTIIDIKVTTGPMVEFFWPNKNNPIIRANPNIGTIFNITSDSQAQEYSIVSNINIRSGVLSYLDRNFMIKQGSLILDENESKFNPILTARAETRDRIDSGPVTITMIIENQPLLSFEPKFESNPGLTQLEIFSILGQNLNMQGVDNPEMVQRFLVSSTTDIFGQIIARSDTLGQLIFMRQLERQVRDFLNLDMLNVRTRFIQNAISSGIANPGTEVNTDPDTPVTVDRNLRVGNYFDNTTVSIGKYIGQDMFIQGTLTMRYDPNSAVLGGIRFEPDIGIEWQSPFVNIRWNFFPSNPQNWFINDNSITLSWSKSFY